MASSIAVRRVTASSPLIKRLLNNRSSLRPLAPAPSALRSFNTNTQMTSYDEGERGVDIDRRDRGVSRRRDAFPSFFPDALDPFSPPRTVTQLLNMMDQFMDSPFQLNRGMGVNRGWDVREDENGLYIRMDMPGVDKENVKVCVEQNTLVIKGEGEKESEDEEHGRRYSSRLDLPSNMYKVDEIRAEMKNGVLKVTVPRVKEEERKDVFQVKVD